MCLFRKHSRIIVSTKIKTSIRFTENVKLNYICNNECSQSECCID